MPRLSIEFIKSDTIPWLAGQIFQTFPGDVTGLMFYIMDCGCIYFQRVFEDGTKGAELGIYRDDKDGECDICMLQTVNWREMVRDVVVVYNSKFEVEFGRKD